MHELLAEIMDERFLSLFLMWSEMTTMIAFAAWLAGLVWASLSGSDIAGED